MNFEKSRDNAAKDYVELDFIAGANWSLEFMFEYKKIRGLMIALARISDPSWRRIGSGYQSSDRNLACIREAKRALEKFNKLKKETK